MTSQHHRVGQKNQRNQKNPITQTVYLSLCNLSFCSYVHQLNMCLVNNSGKEFHVFIALYTTVRLKKMVFALGSENWPFVACQQAYLHQSNLCFHWLYYDRVSYRKTFHVASKSAVINLSSTFSQLIQKCMVLMLVPCGHWRTRCAGWVFYL